MCLKHGEIPPSCSKNLATFKMRAAASLLYRGGSCFLGMAQKGRLQFAGGLSVRNEPNTTLFETKHLLLAREEASKAHDVIESNAVA